MMPGYNGVPDKPSRDILAQIGEFVLDGLSDEEACLLAGYSPQKLKEAREYYPEVNAFFVKKAVELKQKHLRVLTTKPSEKTSQWLLERLYPDEFGSKNKRNEGTTVNVFGAIIKEIQQQNNDQPITGVRELPAAIKADHEQVCETITVDDILKQGGNRTVQQS